MKSKYMQYHEKVDEDIVVNIQLIKTNVDIILKLIPSVKIQYSLLSFKYCFTPSFLTKLTNHSSF